MGILGIVDNYRSVMKNGDEVNLPAPLDVAFHSWTALKKTGPLPAWRDWDWLAIPADAIPWCTVVDYIPYPQDFRYRFWGTARTRIQGYDVTGKSTLDLRPFSVAAKVFREYSEVIDKKHPLLFETFGFGLHESKSYQCLRLPFGDDGNVTQILSMVSYDAFDMELIHDFFRERMQVGTSTR